MTHSPIHNPPIKKVLKALFLAPLSSMLLVFVLTSIFILIEPGGNDAFLSGLMVYLYGVGIAYAHIIFAAIPFYLGMRKKALINRKIAIITGTLIGGVPTTMLLYVAQKSYTVPSLNRQDNLTLYAPCLIFAILGGITGYVFWRIIRKDMPKHKHQTALEAFTLANSTPQNHEG